MVKRKTILLTATALWTTLFAGATSVAGNTENRESSLRGGQLIVTVAPETQDSADRSSVIPTVDTTDIPSVPPLSKATSSAPQTQAADTTIRQAADTTQRPGFFRRFINYFATANEDKTLTKKFDFSIIGGPHYSSDIKLGLGIVAAGLFRADREDLSIPPSNVSLFGDITTTGFYMLGIRGNTLFQGARYRLDYNMYFFSMPSAFWGIGYANGLHNEAGSYKRQQSQLKVDFMYRIATNLYLGLNGSFNFIRGVDFDELGRSYLNYGWEQKTQYINTGVGAFILYDSRDFITNAYRGWYFKLDQRFFPGFMGNHPAFNRTELFVNYYHRLWKDAILAYDLHGQVQTGKVPWTMLSMLGGSSRMRGYYEGRFRDRDILEFQVELRQRIYRRIGAVIWGGAGNVFHSFKTFDFAETLPNYGLGLRWEFKKRVNVRLDYGFGKKEQGFLFSINEAF